MSIVKTGVFLTPTEREEVQSLIIKAQNTPMITLTSGGMDLASMAWENAKKRLYNIALSYGLPDIEGYYGLNEEGEITRN